MKRRFEAICLWMCTHCDTVVSKPAYTSLRNMEDTEPPVRMFVCHSSICGQEREFSPVALRTSDHTLVTEFVTVVQG